MKRLLILGTFTVFMALSSHPSAIAAEKGGHCPVKTVQQRQLPHLNIPRGYHHTFCTSTGQVVVLGGHTTGFIPTATGEYFEDGTWHTFSTIYAHDNGFGLKLADGRIMLGGGYRENLGVGQIYEAEFYDPVTHRCEPAGIMDTRRAHSVAAQLDNGDIIISGNWYHHDAIARYDGRMQFDSICPVSQPRTFPYLLRTAKDALIVIGGTDPHGHPYDTIYVDRVSSHIPVADKTSPDTRFSNDTPALLQTWRPLLQPRPFQSESGMIGSSRANNYQYLIPLQRADGQVSIAVVTNGEFAELSTDYPVPMTCTDVQVNDPAGRERRLNWLAPVIADTVRHCAYMIGNEIAPPSSLLKLCVLRIEYEQQPARLTLLRTEQLAEIGFSTPVLTPDGNLLMVGDSPVSNYHPYATTLLLMVGSDGDALLSNQAGNRFQWLWWLLCMVAVVCVIVCLARRSRTQVADKAPLAADADDTHTDAALLDRIQQVMREEQLYLNPNIKVSDLATRLGTNVTYINRCFSTMQEGGFKQYVQYLRVEHAKQLIRQYSSDDNINMTDAVYPVSGFSSKRSFYRLFKEYTGMTPNEWRKRQADNA